MIDDTIRTYRRTFTYRARDTRREFFSFVLFLMLSQMLFYPLDTVFLAFFELTGLPPGYGEAEAVRLRNQVSGIFAIASLPTLLAALVRRFQDGGHPWWLLFAIIIPYVGWAAIFFAVIAKGEEGPNQWGDDPRQVHSHKLGDEELFE